MNKEQARKGGAIPQKSTLESFNPEDAARGEILMPMKTEKLFQAQNQDLLKKIEGMKRTIIHGDFNREEFDEVNRDIKTYNQALEDIKQLLK